MMRALYRLAAHRAGSAAAEMALVLPLLLLLLFGAFEVGNFFLSEHVVQKGVRDAARYASRVPLGDLTDPGCELATDPTVQTEIKEVARTGLPDGTGEVRLRDWLDNDTVSVVLEPCNITNTYSGVFADFPDGVPVVTVSAAVPYQPFFGGFGLGPGTLTLHASSQAAVFGA